MTGTPEDAEMEWSQHTTGYPNKHDVDIAHAAFLAGYAARPSVTVDEITELLAGHIRYGNREPELCGCGEMKWWAFSEDGEGNPANEVTWEAHAASVIVAHINGEGGTDE